MGGAAHMAQLELLECNYFGALFRSIVRRSASKDAESNNCDVKMFHFLCLCQQDK
jgi:hypothetical protein